MRFYIRTLLNLITDVACCITFCCYTVHYFQGPSWASYGVAVIMACLVAAGLMLIGEDLHQLNHHHNPPTDAA